MVRILRPLPPVLMARLKGEDPEAIEAKRRAQRNFDEQTDLRERANGRFVFAAAVCVLVFALIGWRMLAMAWSEIEEPTNTARLSEPIINLRADITDRHGVVLATNMATHAVLTNTGNLIDPEHAARELAKIFPQHSYEALLEDFTGRPKFMWISHKTSPEQMQAVHDIGEPGLEFGPREIRIYPNGRLASHVLGGTGFGRLGVNAVEVEGRAGAEKYFDERLSDPARATEPLRLSIDGAVQFATEDLLQNSMDYLKARGAAAVLMDVNTGEILSLVSLPDFDVNDRPAPPSSGDPALSPLFNRVVQGRYELGSTFKIFAAAVALERGMTGSSLVNTKGPLQYRGTQIKDYHRMPAQMPLREVITESSNVGTARLAREAGVEAQKEMLDRLGFLDPTGVELPEAGRISSLVPARWGEVELMTISYGHGIATTPLHLATAYAEIANGGVKITPTILALDPVDAGLSQKPRLLNAQHAAELTDFLRGVVEEGTASIAKIDGYEIAGKTGSADKTNPAGGYFKDRVLASFAAVFPARAPRYVLVVVLDEPSVNVLGEERRTAGWTSVTAAAEIVSRVAPMLGLAPDMARR